MSELIFEDYLVESISYIKNTQFDMSKEPRLSTDFNAEINILDKNNASVHLKTTIGNERSNSPFVIQAEICGKFSYVKSPEQEIQLNFEDYLSTNAIAILFPYLRSVVSDISSKSNEFPTLLLPVLNIAEVLKDRHLITINRPDEEIDKKNDV